MNFFTRFFGSRARPTPASAQPGSTPGWKVVVDEAAIIAEKEAAKHFTDNGDGTVTDVETGLMWQKNDDGQKRDWNDAMEYADALSLAGHSDWRLPSTDELVSLSKNAGQKSVIRNTYFPGMKSSEYWTSKTYENNAGDAYYVSFSVGDIYAGSVSYCYKTYTYYVRCVRM